MLTHLLDTSVYCQPIKRRFDTTARTRWEQAGDDALAISVICDAEVQFGLSLKNSERLWREYNLFLKGRLVIFPIDEEIASVFADLKAATRKSGQSCSDLDLLIAATARRHDLIVATLNPRHFSGLPRVSVEDWAK